MNTRCSRKWAIPFSSGRSVRAPASKATSTVTARVPGRSTRYSGSPLGKVEEWIFAMGKTVPALAQFPLQAGEIPVAANTLPVVHGCH